MSYFLFTLRDFMSEAFIQQLIIASLQNKTRNIKHSMVMMMVMMMVSGQPVFGL